MEKRWGNYLKHKKPWHLGTRHPLCSILVVSLGVHTVDTQAAVSLGVHTVDTQAAVSLGVHTVDTQAAASAAPTCMTSA